MQNSPILHVLERRCRCWRAFVALLMLSFLAAVALVASSCSSPFSRAAFAPPVIEGASFVGNHTCAECHTNYTRVFHGSPHARLNIRIENAPGGIGCESCHGPGSKHVAAGGGRGGLIVNPGKDATACFNCHLDTHAEFRLPQHHPVLEEKMNCVDCHDPHGAEIFKRAGGISFARQNENCASCHREQSKMVIFEHEALREGCTVCHAPHGSINDKMLVQRDNNLCLKCHAQTHLSGGEIFIGQTPHAAFLRRGTCWSAGCHTAVHGSNIDVKLRH